MPVIKQNKEEQKAILFSFYNEDIGGYRQIIYGNRSEIFKTVKDLYPVYAEILLKKHWDSLIENDQIEIYLEEGKRSRDESIENIQPKMLIEDLLFKLSKETSNIHLSTKQRPIVNHEWYKLWDCMFDNLDEDEHLYIGLENTLPVFCKELFLSELSLFKHGKKTNEHYILLGRLALLASFSKFDWKSDVMKNHFREYVNMFNDINAA